MDGILEVSNSFPLPHYSGDDEDKSAKSTSVYTLLILFRLVILTIQLARYQASMLRSLKEVRSDDSVVGFYQCINMGAFFSQTLIDTQRQKRDDGKGWDVLVTTYNLAQGDGDRNTDRLSRRKWKHLDACVHTETALVVGLDALGY